MYMYTFSIHVRVYMIYIVHVHVQCTCMYNVQYGFIFIKIANSCTCKIGKLLLPEIFFDFASYKLSYWTYTCTLYMYQWISFYEFYNADNCKNTCTCTSQNSVYCVWVKKFSWNFHFKCNETEFANF